jgi:hypothetical protein
MLKGTYVTKMNIAWAYFYKVNFSKEDTSPFINAHQSEFGDDKGQCDYNLLNGMFFSQIN